MPDTSKPLELKRQDDALTAFAEVIYNSIVGNIDKKRIAKLIAEGKAKRGKDVIVDAIIQNWEAVAPDKATANIVLCYIKNRLQQRWELIDKAFDALIERDKKDLVLNKPVRQIVALYFERLTQLTEKPPTTEVLEEVETLVDSLSYLLFMISHFRKAKGLNNE